MMMSEFIERTNYEPTYEEYRIIEDAYYEFDGMKDEFCKQWLKDKKSGYWEREYGIRKAARKEREALEAEVKALREQNEEANELIRKLGDERYSLKEELKRVNEALENQEKTLAISTKAFDEMKAEYNRLMDALSVIKNAIA